VTARFSISPMRRRDLKGVMRIEETMFPEPWSVEVFASELALRQGRAYRVARVGRILVGYFGLMFVEDEAHVTTLAVDRDWQGRSYGKLLMLEVVRTSLEHGSHHLSLEVATGNERAKSLYRRFGLAPVGVRKHYYPATGEDAIVMWARDIDEPAYHERLVEIEAEIRCQVT
jgi:[ribosomal protein S18]-alanine N-acetyltransferase